MKPATRSGRGPGGVVLGGYVNGLGVLRALAALGVPTAVVRTRPFDLAHRSRACGESLDAVGAEEDPERLVELLERRAEEWAGWALVPTNDWTLVALAEHRERLERVYRVVAPSREAVEVLLDKERTAAVAAELGIAVPRTFGPASAATVRDPGLEFPVLVKPRIGHRFAEAFGVKLFVASDRAELGRAVERVVARDLACSVLEWIPGGGDQIYAHCAYLDGDGEPRGGVTVHKLRQGPAGFGVARVAEIAPELPELREASVSLLRRIGVRGPATVEFKRDPRDGAFRLLEVNGRSVLYNALARRGGVDLTALAWADFVEGRPRTATPRPWPGVWVNLHSDLLHSLVDGRREGLSFRAFLAPYRRPWFDAVFSARDPLPFLVQWIWTARRALAAWRGGRRPRRRWRPPLWVDDLARPALDLLRSWKGRAASSFVHVVTPQAAYPEVVVRAHGEAEEVPTPELPGLPLAAPCRALRAASYRTPPRYTMLLPGVLYEPSQNVVATPRFEPIEQPNQVPRRLHHYRWRPWLVDRRRVVRLAGTFTSLRSFRDNYFHTLVDNVPALDLLREPPYRDLERIELVLAPPLSPAEEFLLARTLPANVVPRFLEPGRFYELERYVFTSFLSQRYSGYLPAACAAALVARCAGDSPARSPGAERPRRRIFVSRAQARNGYRHIVNEDEVMALLGGRGFERVWLEGMAPAEQIALFRDAGCVVAAHGAGLANLLFARGADVVELFPQACVWPHFYLLGRSGGHRYHHLCGDRPARNDRFRVDVAALAAILDRIEAATAAPVAAAG